MGSTGRSWIPSLHSFHSGAANHSPLSRLFAHSTPTTRFSPAKSSSYTPSPSRTCHHVCAASISSAVSVAPTATRCASP
uniref:Uncharacterized protein n=1 Tax=Arundo donax TaxID=35708 RepID=A0A0A9DBC3_ARUDO